MTISIAWVRQAGKSKELIVASDSRLSSAGHVDVCQKIFPLSRGDTFFAFCGDTFLAFPFIFQLQSAISNFQKAADRSEDVTTLLGRVLTLLNAYRASWHDTIETDVQNTNKITRFLFGGWSWRHSKFYVYALQYSNKSKSFTAHTHSRQYKSLGLPSRDACFVMGNYAAEFRHLLRLAITEKGLKSLNYEPLDILGHMLSDERFTMRNTGKKFFVEDEKPGAIGGAPQALKIYQHANSKSIAVRWPIASQDSSVCIYGRPLFPWENTFSPIYDLSSKEFYYPLSELAAGMRVGHHPMVVASSLGPSLVTASPQLELGGDGGVD